MFEHKVSQPITYQGYCFDHNVKMPLDQNRKSFPLQARLPAALQVKIEVNLWEHAFTCIKLMEKLTAILLFEFLFYFCNLFTYAYVIHTHSYVYQVAVLYCHWFYTSFLGKQKNSPIGFRKLGVRQSEPACESYK